MEKRENEESRDDEKVSASALFVDVERLRAVKVKVEAGACVCVDVMGGTCTWRCSHLFATDQGAQNACMANTTFHHNPHPSYASASLGGGVEGGTFEAWSCTSFGSMLLFPAALLFGHALRLPTQSLLANSGTILVECRCGNVVEERLSIVAGEILKQ